MELFEAFKEFIKPELLILIPVLYLIGIGMKKSEVKDKFIPLLLGIVAIDGSPSCGYNFTYRGKWGGELGSCNNLKEKLDTIELSYESGVFIDELKKALSEKKLEISIRTLKDQVSYLKNL